MEPPAAILLASTRFMYGKALNILYTQVDQWQSGGMNAKRGCLPGGVIHADFRAPAREQRLGAIIGAQTDMYTKVSNLSSCANRWAAVRHLGRC